MNPNTPLIAKLCAVARLLVHCGTCCLCKIPGIDMHKAFCDTCFSSLHKCITCGKHTQWVSANGSKVENCLECVLSVELLTQNITSVMAYYVNDIIMIDPITTTTATTTAMTAATVSSSSPPKSPPTTPPRNSTNVSSKNRLCGNKDCGKDPENPRHFHCEACHHQLLRDNQKIKRVCYHPNCGKPTCSNFPNTKTGGILFSCVDHSIKK